MFTHAQLLQEVWGYDFSGGTRTVDVHVRRLRAKLGPEYEQLIGTVRNVGYKFVRPGRPRSHSQRHASDDLEGLALSSTAEGNGLITGTDTNLDLSTPGQATNHDAGTAQRG